jgi:hypothetical protein
MLRLSKYQLVAVVVILALIIAGLSWYVVKTTRQDKVTNYQQCAAAGYPIDQSYPETCSTPGGERFTDPAGKRSPIVIPGQGCVAGAGQACPQ